MRTTTIAAAPGSSRAFIADVGKATQRTAKSRAAVFLRVAKVPTVSALARRKDIRRLVGFFWQPRGDKV